MPRTLTLNIGGKSYSVNWNSSQDPTESDIDDIASQIAGRTSTPQPRPLSGTFGGQQLAPMPIQGLNVKPIESGDYGLSNVLKRPSLASIPVSPTSVYKNRSAKVQTGIIPPSYNQTRFAKPSSTANIAQQTVARTQVAKDHVSDDKSLLDKLSNILGSVAHAPSEAATTASNYAEKLIGMLQGGTGNFAPNNPDNVQAEGNAVRGERLAQNLQDLASFAIPVAGQIAGAAGLGQIGVNAAQDPVGTAKSIGASLNPFSEGLNPEDRVLHAINALLLVAGGTHIGSKVFELTPKAKMEAAFKAVQDSGINPSEIAKLLETDKEAHSLWVNQTRMPVSTEFKGSVKAKANQLTPEEYQAKYGQTASEIPQETQTNASQIESTTPILSDLRTQPEQSQATMPENVEATNARLRGNERKGIAEQSQTQEEVAPSWREKIRALYEQQKLENERLFKERKAGTPDKTLSDFEQNYYNHPDRFNPSEYVPGKGPEDVTQKVWVELQSPEYQEGRAEGHKRAVERALSMKEAVPPEVLDDYPDLVEKYINPKYRNQGAKEVAPAIVNQIEAVKPTQGDYNPDVIGNNQAQREAQGANRGYDATIGSTKGRGIEPDKVEGRKAYLSGTFDPDVAIKRLIDEKRGANPYEQGGFEAHHAKLIQAFDKAQRDFDVNPNDPRVQQRFADARMAAESWDKKLDEIGGNAGRSLAGLKTGVEINLANSAQVVTYARKVKGADLDPKVQSQLEEMTRQLRDTQAALEKAQITISEKAAQEAFRRERVAASKNARQPIKEQLNAEFELLNKQLMRAAGRVSSGLDPEIAVVLAKMVSNRVRFGALSLQDAVAPVFEAVKDHIQGITERDIMDAYSGYGTEKPTRVTGETQKIESKIKTEARLQSQLEDAKLGKEPIKRSGAIGPTSPAVDALNNRINRLRADIRKTIEAQRPKNFAERLGEYARTSALSGLGTFANLSAAVTGHQALTPFEELAGPLVKHTIGRIGGVSKMSGAELKFDPKAEFAAIKEWVNPQTYLDIADKLKGGEGEIGNKAISEGVASPHDQNINPVLKFEQATHAAMKTVTQRNAFTREWMKQLALAEKNGIDTQDPSVRADLFVKAYEASQRGMLMNKNAVSKALSSASGGNKVVKGIMNVFMPIKSVPTNIAGRQLEYVFGIPYGIGRALIESSRGNMTPELAETLARAEKRGLVGASLITLAYNMPKWDVDDKGNLMVGGKRVPSALGHIPALEAIKVGIEYRKAKGALSHKLGATVAGTASNAFNELPFINAAQTLTSLEAPYGSSPEQKEKALSKGLGKMTASIIIPQGIQQIARARDTSPAPKNSADVFKNMFWKTQDANPRRSEGFTDEYKKLIPGQREKLRPSKKR